MPIYEYRCEQCGELSEVFLKSREPEPTTCPTCGGKLRKIISQSGFQFKGTGWYVTDYARKDKKANSESRHGKPKPKADEVKTTPDKPDTAKKTES